MTCGIYAAICKEDGRAYVGQSINIEKRWRQHAAMIRCGEQRHFYNAVRKYGESAFDWIVVQECEQDQLDFFEMFWVGIFGSFNTGFNYSIGGAGKRRRKHSAASIEKMRAIKLGKTRTPEARRKTSESLMGRPRSQEWKDKVTGQKRSDEARARMALAQAGRTFSEETRKKMSEAAKRRGSNNRRVTAT